MATYIIKNKLFKDEFFNSIKEARESLSEWLFENSDWDYLNEENVDLSADPKLNELYNEEIEKIEKDISMIQNIILNYETGQKGAFQIKEVE